MTLLMWFNDGEVFEIITDTLASDLERQSVGIESKAFHLEDRRLIVAGTGVANLVHSWVRVLRAGDPRGGVDELAEFAPALLQRLWDELIAGAPPGAARFSATIYHFGVSRSGRLVWTRFGSREGFHPKRDDREGFWIKPEPVVRPTRPLDTDQDVIDLAEAVRAEQASDPGGVPIGGSLRRTVLINTGQAATEEIYLFDDYDVALQGGEHG